jgi:hypothetical protein
MSKFIIIGIICLFLVSISYAQMENMALQLDGVDDYVEVLDASSLDLTGPLTLSAWFRYS